MNEPTTPAGTIYDLGYKRYLGTRRGQGTRWQVITRSVLRQAWKTWWRYKAWLGLAVIITIVIGSIMVFARSEELGELRRHGIVVRVVDQLLFSSVRWYSIVAFLTTLTVAAGIVASDLRSGAFTFYFSRPVRPVDYILGKVLGVFLLLCFVTLVPILVLAIVRLGLSETTEELIDTLGQVPRALAVGGLTAAGFTGAALGFSALFGNPRLNTGLWAAYYMIVGTMFFGAAVGTENTAIGVVDPMYAALSVSTRLAGYEYAFGGLPVAPLVPAVSALLAYFAAGIAIAYARVSAAGHAGIGGGS